MTTVEEVFAYAGVEYGGAAPWGADPSETGSGVYVVASTKHPDAVAGLGAAPLSLSAVSALLTARPEAAVDGRRATVESLAARLESMWPSGEPVIYIGLASRSVRRRMRQFYATAIGARAPHAGGWPVKMLDDSAGLWVHFGPTDTPDTAETAMLSRFAAGLPQSVRAELIDPGALLPFANLMIPRGRRKRHGISGVKAPRARAVPGELDAGRPSPDENDANSVETHRQAVDGTDQTQNVTASDIERSQLRIPRNAKRLLPAVKSRVAVRLGGFVCEAAWDPRTEGDKERSGVLRFPIGVLRAYISAGAPRRIESTDDGIQIS